MAIEWTEDEYGCLNFVTTDIEGRPVHAWIEKRRPGCDRGFYVANVNGIIDLDGQDGFPRYYMRLGVAKGEMEDWLRWRLYRIPPKGGA